MNALYRRRAQNIALRSKGGFVKIFTVEHAKNEPVFSFFNTLY